MAFGELDYRAEKVITPVITGAAITIVANMGIKRLSIRVKQGSCTVQGGSATFNDGVNTYTSAAQTLVAGDINTIQSSEGYFIDGYTITAGALDIVYLEAVI